MGAPETIVVIGFGWVGQANALALSSLGYPVSYYDTGTPVLHYWKEHRLLYEQIARLQAPLEKDGVHTRYIISVGDRVSQEGVQDISLIRKASEMLSEASGTVVLRSTVLPEHLPQIRFDYYLPEFLHEKYAIEECLNPLYLVIGRNSETKREPDFFHEWETRAGKVFRGTPREAAHIKYLSNVWNALRISFVNEMGDMISCGGIDRARAMRVIDFFFEQKAYLRYGRAYGGHCLPKDTLALWHSGSLHGSAGLIRAIHEANERHKKLGRAYEGLPEWFSRSEFVGRGMTGAARRFWRAVNALSLIRRIRSFLRPFRLCLNRFAPRRSLWETKRLWNRLARRRARYFAHPGAESGRNVSDYELRESGCVEYERLIERDDALRTLLRERRAKTALDLGVGVGRHGEFFARDFSSFIGVDIAEEMLAVAQKRLGGLPNITLIPTDGRHIVVPDASVDFIFSRETFESIADERVIESYFSEMFRTLRGGGVAKIELRTGATPYRWRYSYGLSFTADEARSLFERAGLSVLSVVPDGTKHMWVTAVKP